MSSRCWEYMFRTFRWTIRKRSIIFSNIIDHTCQFKSRTSSVRFLYNSVHISYHCHYTSINNLDSFVNYISMHIYLCIHASDIVAGLVASWTSSIAVHSQFQAFLRSTYWNNLRTISLEYLFIFINWKQKWNFDVNKQPIYNQHHFRHRRCRCCFVVFFFFFFFFLSSKLFCNMCVIVVFYKFLLNRKSLPVFEQQAITSRRSKMKSYEWTNPSLKHDMIRHSILVDKVRWYTCIQYIGSCWKWNNNSWWWNFRRWLFDDLIGKSKELCSHRVFVVRYIKDMTFKSKELDQFVAPAKYNWKTNVRDR
jgi:hypothetical protein